MVARSSGLRRPGKLAALAAGQRADRDVEVAVAEHFWGRIGFAMGCCFCDEAVDDLETELFVGLLPPFESQLDAHLHVVAQEFDGVVEFGLEVVRIDVRAELKLLHATAGRFIAFLSFGFLVEELAIVDNTADRRGGGGGNFDEIELAVSCQLKGGIERHDAELLLVIVDHANFAGADLAISAVKWFVTLELSEW